MSEGKDFENPFNEYRFPADKAGKGKAIKFNPQGNPEDEEMQARINAVAATKPASLQEFFQRLADLD